MAYETHVTGTGQTIYTHTREQCVGEHCPIHYPSKRAMAVGKTHWRPDRGIMERVCEHGVGHPDPDDVKVQAGGWTETIHGCDGCCNPLYGRLLADGWSEETASMAVQVSMTQTHDPVTDRPYRKFAAVKRDPEFFVDDIHIGDLARKLCEEYDARHNTVQGEN